MEVYVSACACVCLYCMFDCMSGRYCVYMRATVQVCLFVCFSMYKQLFLVYLDDQLYSECTCLVEQSADDYLPM